MRLHHFLPLLFLALLIGLISCQLDPKTELTESTPAATAKVNARQQKPTVTPQLAAEPGKHLTICMAEEPATLYWYGRSSLSEEAVLHGIYENDFTTLSFDIQPLGLAAIPTLPNLDATFRIVPVETGDKVVDASGDVITLAPGDEVITDEGELVVFDGNPMLMEQLVVDFVMKQRYWSDGRPLTASDSEYSFRLAAHPDTPNNKFITDRTSSYQATGNLSVRWAGLPGFKDDNFQTNFFHPLPEHAWRNLSELELVDAEQSSRLPLGDGPFRVVEWLPGESIHLEPNSFYYRSNWDLPHLDSVTFEFIPDTNQRISKLLAGHCQLITHENLDMDMIPFFMEAKDAQLLNAFIRPGKQRWQISFGVNSASGYGDGFGRPDWFEDARVRQAVALCINRQQIIDTVLSGHSFIPHSYVHAAHPLLADDVSRYPFDWSAANALLDDAGFPDSNFDGLREDPTSGTEFRISIITSYDRTERAVAQLVSESLQACGIELVIEALPDELRYIEGEENRIYGRRFDLALVPSNTEQIPACEQFASWQISGPAAIDNTQTGDSFSAWSGSNHTGWSNPEYDAACASALNAMPSTADHSLYQQQAQLIFAENLPVLPLFFSPGTTASSTAVPYINNDPTQKSELWNLFAIDMIQ